MSLQSQFPPSVWSARLSTMYESMVAVLNNTPFPDSIDMVDKAHQLSHQLGDTEGSVFSSLCLILLQLDLRPIPELVRQVRESWETMRYRGQKFTIAMCQPAMDQLLGLTSRTDGDFGVLRSTGFNPQDAVEWDRSSNLYLWFCHTRLVNHYLLGEYEKAEVYVRDCVPLLRQPIGMGDVAVVAFFVGMWNVGMVQRCIAKSSWCHTARKVLSGRYYRLQALHCLSELKRFASHAPVNFLGKMHLLDAEISSLTSPGEARFKYISAISLAREARTYVVLALSLEKLGKFLWQCDDRKAAIEYLVDAENVYREYGADIKVDQLHREVAKLQVRLQQGSI